MKHKYELTYGNIRGLSCAYRNWKDEESSMLHGYALAFAFWIGANDLSALEEFVFNKDGFIGQYLEEVFCNTVLVAKDDPAMDAFLALEKAGACDLRINDAVGIDVFARELWAEMSPLIKQESDNTVTLLKVTVSERGNYHASFEDLTVE